MTGEQGFYSGLLLCSFVMALGVFPLLFFLSAPYGRHARPGWGPQISSTLGWVLMELPAVLVFGACFVLGGPERWRSPAALCFLLLWQLHYVHRALVFPFRRRGGDRPMPLLVAGMALVFNCMNGYLNGRWLYHFGPARDASWLLGWRFLLGAALFALGFAINYHADRVLINLRRPGETGYKIPSGGLYRLVTCPNYLGEMIEWTGWALATWSLSGLAFALWTAANLLPRALSNHRWYRERFPSYPRERRAVIPFLL